MSAHVWHFVVFLCMIILVFQLSLSVFIQQDTSRSTEERARCEEAASKYALDALDFYLDPKLKVEGIAIIDGSQVSDNDIKDYIQNRLSNFDANKSDVQNLRVTNIRSFSTGQYSQIAARNDDLLLEGEQRAVQQSYPSVEFEVEGEILRLVTKANDSHKTFKFNIIIKVVLDNLSRNDNYKDNTNIDLQPYNNDGSWG